MYIFFNLIIFNSGVLQFITSLILSYCRAKKLPVDLIDLIKLIESCNNNNNTNLRYQTSQDGQQKVSLGRNYKSSRTGELLPDEAHTSCI